MTGDRQEPRAARSCYPGRIRRTGYGPCPLRPYAAEHDYRVRGGGPARCCCGAEPQVSDVP